MLLGLCIVVGFFSCGYGFSMLELEKRQGLIPFPRVGRAFPVDNSDILTSEDMKDVLIENLLRSNRFKRDVEIESNDEWAELLDDDYPGKGSPEEKKMNNLRGSSSRNNLAPRLGRSGYKNKSLQPRLGRGFAAFSPRLGRADMNPRLGKRFN